VSFVLTGGPKPHRYRVVRQTSFNLHATIDFILDLLVIAIGESFRHPPDSRGSLAAASFLPRAKHLHVVASVTDCRKSSN
jgi:hypothetical protein